LPYEERTKPIALQEGNPPTNLVATMRMDEDSVLPSPAETAVW